MNAHTEVTYSFQKVAAPRNSWGQIVTFCSWNIPGLTPPLNFSTDSFLIAWM